jgi:hypothetical protein
MGLETKIIDGEGSKKRVGSKTTKEFGTGLKVYTFEGNPLGFQSATFTNDTYGAALNQDASVGGTPDQVHNGIDSVLWTAAATVGSWAFNETAQAHTGTKSIDATGTVNNDLATISKGSSMTIANYQALTGWIYITSWSTSGTKDVQIEGYNSATVSVEGTTINLSSYIDTTLFNTWQKFTIPFVDFAFTSSTLDAIRIRTIDVGAGAPPNYYLDDIQFEETGGPIIFTVGPQPGEKWRITNLSYILADAYAGTVTNGTMPSIPYTGFLGVSSLTNGTTIRRIQFGETQFSNTTTDFIDYISTAAPKKVISGSDGTNTWVRLEATFENPIIFDGGKSDRYELIINDDLSGLLYYKAVIAYCEELS